MPVFSTFRPLRSPDGCQLIAMSRSFGLFVASGRLFVIILRPCETPHFGRYLGMDSSSLIVYCGIDHIIEYGDLSYSRSVVYRAEQVVP